MLVAFLFAALIGRLIYIEAVKSDELMARALDQWMRDVPLEAERGHIYDINGVLLADSRTVYTVYVRPNAVKNKQETAAALSEVLELDYQTVLGKVQSRRSEMTIVKGVEKEAMLALLESEASGIYYSQNIERVYPYGDFMTQVLGFTNFDSNGQAGIEMRYNDYLKSVNGYILTETDLVGRELKSNVTRYVAGVAGNDIYLTLDYNIQAFAESAVAEAKAKHNAKSVSVVVMNINTGEVLAMAEAPSFDLNNVPRDDVAKLFSHSKSSLVSNVFEPGSTFKILTAAIGLDTGAVSRDYRFFCPGYHIVDGQRIKCWKTTGHGSLSFDEGVHKSCNILFMNTALKIGSETFYEKLYDFGIMTRTGIDIAGEASGLSIPLASVKSVDLARIGFGQAIAVTPIELVRAAAAVLNGGVMVTPYVVDRAVSSSGEIIYKNSPTLKSGVISEKTSSDMREILEGVVTQGGGKSAGVAGYRIGGKTGTAQKYENGIIARGKYVSTFVGFAPADKPEYIAMIIVDEPQGAYYGSLVAAPYIGDVFAKIFAYKGIAPSAYVKKEEFAMPDIRGLTVIEAARILRGKNIFYETAGEGSIVNSQLPAPGSMVTEDVIALINLE
ncbi:MAG: penicillin-binding transpeptidase domain-containing protein [Clostridia bacterium]